MKKFTIQSKMYFKKILTFHILCWSYDILYLQVSCNLNLSQYFHNKMFFHKKLFYSTLANLRALISTAPNYAKYCRPVRSKYCASIFLKLCLMFNIIAVLVGVNVYISRNDKNQPVGPRLLNLELVFIVKFLLYFSFLR